jgi:hypothetical protein
LIWKFRLLWLWVLVLEKSFRLVVHGKKLS